MTTRAALAAGTAVSLAVTAVWSWTATLSIGAPAAPRLTRNLPGDYAQLAAAATGSSPWALFAVVAAIYVLCFLASGLLARRRALREAAGDLDPDQDTRPATAYGKAA
jgi:hypothetical protein